MTDLGDVLRVTSFFTMPNASVPQMVNWFLCTEAGTDSDTIDSIAIWAMTWAQAWQELASDEAHFDRFEVSVMREDGTVARDMGGEVINMSGEVSGEIMPAGVAGFGFAPTEEPKVRGRKFIPGIAELALTDGIFTGQNMIRLTALVIALFNGIGTPGVGLAAGVLSTVLGRFVEFSGTKVASAIPAYQRRRKPNVGS